MISQKYNILCCFLVSLLSTLFIEKGYTETGFLANVPVNVFVDEQILEKVYKNGEGMHQSVDHNKSKRKLNILLQEAGEKKIDDVNSWENDSGTTSDNLEKNPSLLGVKKTSGISQSIESNQQSPYSSDFHQKTPCDNSDSSNSVSSNSNFLYSNFNNYDVVDSSNTILEGSLCSTNHECTELNSVSEYSQLSFGPISTIPVNVSSFNELSLSEPHKSGHLQNRFLQPSNNYAENMGLERPTIPKRLNNSSRKLRLNKKKKAVNHRRNSASPVFRFESPTYRQDYDQNTGEILKPGRTELPLLGSWVEEFFSQLDNTSNSLSESTKISPVGSPASPVSCSRSPIYRQDYNQNTGEILEPGRTEVPLTGSWFKDLLSQLDNTSNSLSESTKISPVGSPASPVSRSRSPIYRQDYNQNTGEISGFGEGVVRNNIRNSNSLFQPNPLGNTLVQSSTDQQGCGQNTGGIWGHGNEQNVVNRQRKNFVPQPTQSSDAHISSVSLANLSKSSTYQQSYGQNTGGTLGAEYDSELIKKRTFFPSDQLTSAHLSNALSARLPSSTSSTTESADQLAPEYGLYYTEKYRGSQKCWIAVYPIGQKAVLFEVYEASGKDDKVAMNRAKDALNRFRKHCSSGNTLSRIRENRRVNFPNIYESDGSLLVWKGSRTKSFSFEGLRRRFQSIEDAFGVAVLWLIATPCEEADIENTYFPK